MVFGKLVFDRKVMGRLATERKVIKKTGAKVDFENFTDTCEARVVGSEESVSRALIKEAEDAVIKSLDQLV